LPQEEKKKEASLNKTVIVVVIAIFFALCAPGMAADAIVGKIYDVATKKGKITALFIADDKQNGHVITVNCETVYAMECKAAPGAIIEIGENVKIDKANDLVVVTKITAGHN